MPLLDSWKGSIPQRAWESLISSSGEKIHTVTAPWVSVAADMLHMPKRKGLPGVDTRAKGRKEGVEQKGVSAASEQGPGLSLSLVTMAAQAVLAFSQERFMPGRSD